MEDRTCEEWQATFTQSLYEELEGAEQAALAQHLSECAECRSENGASAAFLEAIPDAIPYTIDISDSVIQALQENRRRSNRWAASALGLAAACAVVVGGALLFGDGNARPDAAPNRTATSESEGLFAVVDGLLESRQYAAAYAALDEARTSGTLPDEAQGLVWMAEIAYDRLNWYAQAHDALLALDDRHPHAFAQDDSLGRRLAILNTTAGPDRDYGSLYAYDLAARDADFASLEELVGRYPATAFAAMSADSMAAIVQAESSDPVESPLAGALARCTNPVAAAHLKMQLAHSRRETNPAEARSYYEEVLESGYPVLARAAGEALDSMARTQPEAP